MSQPTGITRPGPNKRRAPYMINVPGNVSDILQLDANGQPAWVTPTSVVSPVDYVDFNTAYAVAPVEGRLQWNPDTGTLEVGMPGGVFGQVLQDQFVYVTNQEGGPIPFGTPVYTTDAAGTEVRVKIASNETVAEAIVLGLAAEDIADGDSGRVYTYGWVDGLDTSLFTEGLPVWLGVDGALSNVRPDAGTAALQSAVGICIEVDALDGVILCRPYYLQQLQYLSDVYAPVINDDDILAWDAGDGRFEPRQATVSTPVVLPAFVDQNQRNLDQNLHGGLDTILAAQAVNSGAPLNATVGTGKVVVVVNAGADLEGTLTVTGTTVDRNTGVETPADTADLTIVGLSTDGTSPDAEGNVVCDLSNAYITDKWFKGAVVLSTADVDLSDIDIYVVAFNQFNDTSGITVQALDVTLVPTNVAAWVYMYLYSVVVTGDLVDITVIGSISLPAADSVADRFYRLRKGLLNVAIDGLTDGVFLKVFFGPDPQTYITQVTINIWADLSLPVTLT